MTSEATYTLLRSFHFDCVSTCENGPHFSTDEEAGTQNKRGQVKA